MTIHQRDCRELVEVFADLPEAVLFLDPPYPLETTNTRRQQVYEHDMSADEHSALCEALRKVKAAVIVTMNPGTVYSEMLADWPVTPLPVRGQRNNTKTELIFTNFVPSADLFGRGGGNMRPQDIRVLVGCEYSGIVRDAFLARGYDAWSCDLLPSERASNRHMQMDIRIAIRQGWHLAIIAHPPCTRLCNSGVRWLTRPPRGRTLEEMWAELEAGAALFSDVWNADVPFIAVENPVMHKHARARIRNYQPPTQIIQPHQFGEPQFKATGLYLRALEPLVPTNRLSPPAVGTPEHRQWSRVHRHSGWGRHGIERARERSRFFPGVANAMADQWGGYVARRLAA